MIAPGTADAELQIIARDSKGLSTADRDVLREAAEAYSEIQRLLWAYIAALEQSQQSRDALTDKVRELTITLNDMRRLPSWARF